MGEAVLDAIDRAIVNRLQSGFPVCERPYLAAAEMLGIGEDELIGRLERLLADGVLTRFGLGRYMESTYYRGQGEQAIAPPAEPNERLPAD